jgi:hypothetical protein
MEVSNCERYEKWRHRRGVVSRAMASIFILLGIASFAMAQVSNSASVRGTVRDPNGAVISNATVVMTNNQTKFEQKATSNAEGIFNFPLLTPGFYTLKVEAQGFKGYEEPNLEVKNLDTLGLEVMLEVGAATETVTVQATEELQTETGAHEDTLSSKQIDNLSMISRSSLELLRILPGVVAPNLDDPNFEALGFNVGANANGNYSVNGLRGVDINVVVDGSRVIDIGSNNGTMITANPDMVQQVTIQSSNYAAEHGSSGAQIVATTKSGGSQYHGEVYDYERNHALNANDRSNTLFGIAKPDSTYHFPGGNFGGPVPIPHIKDKVFFFFGAEVQRQEVDPGATFNTVPSLLERQGIPPTGPSQVANINPIGKALINLYPLPNFKSTVASAIPGDTQNYVDDVLSPLNRTQGTLRVDYNINDSTKMYVRLAREAETQTFNNGLWWEPSSYALPTPVQGQNLGRSAAVSLTKIINPTMTNEIVFSASRLLLNNNYADPSKVSLAGTGLTALKGPFGSGNFAPVNLITSWGEPGTGDLWSPGGLPIFAHNDSVSVTDNLSKVWGAHTLKFGGTFERASKQQTISPDNSGPDGEFVYAPWAGGSTGNVFEDILTGHPAQYTQTTASPIGNWRFFNLEVYAQDSWKVRHNLTLEYGLRVGYFPSNDEVNGLANAFSPSAYIKGQGVLVNGNKTDINGLLQNSLGQLPQGLLPNPPPQVMPRFNFAWDVTGKGDWVIRGGAGMFYNRVQGNYQYYTAGNPPNVYTATFSSGLTGYGPTPGNLSGLNPFGSLAAVSLSTADLGSNHIPRIVTDSLSIARRLPKQTVLEVSFVNTEARHLPDLRNIDYVPVGAMLSGMDTVGSTTYNLSIPAQRLAAGNAGGAFISNYEPYPAYSAVNQFEFDATSHYNSLQATLSHQAGKNLQFFATYTFSKAIGVTGVNETDGNGIASIDVRGRSYGILPFDRTNVFNLSYNYQLPSGVRGDSKFNNAFTRGVLNGWQTSGITTIQSGTPIYIKFSGDLASVGSSIAWYGTNGYYNPGSINIGAITPIYTGNPSRGGTSFGSSVLSLSDLSIPAFQNSGPYEAPFNLRTPMRTDTDMTLFKNFPIGEGAKKIQFRVGAFDIFNLAYARYSPYNSQSTNDINTTLNVTCNQHVNVNGNSTCNPLGGYSFTNDSQFGQIIDMHGHRSIELALKFYF